MIQASTEKLEYTGPAEKGKGGLSAIERAVGKYAGATLAKRNRAKKARQKGVILRISLLRDGALDWLRGRI